MGQMAPSKRAIGIRSTVEALTKAIAEERIGRNGLLPSLSRLAHAFGVSRSTMWKAVGRLKSAGLLSVVEGGKIRVAHIAPEPQAKNKYRWEVVSRKIFDDLQNRKMTGIAQKPSIRELQQRFSASYLTIRKALNSLAAAGILEQSRGFAPTHAGIGISNPSTIAVFTAQSDDPVAVAAIYRDRTRIMTDLLERMCGIQGLRIRFETLNPAEAGREREKIRQLNRNPNIIGYLVNPSWSGGGKWNSDLVALIDSLASSGKPIAIVDHTQAFPQKLLRRGAHIRIYRSDNRSAGACVAAALLARGHRRVAFVSDWHRFAWSTTRLSGMQETFAAAPAGCRLFEITSDRRDGPFQLTFNALRLSDSRFKEIFSPGNTPMEFSRLEHRNREVRDLVLFAEEDRVDVQRHAAGFLQFFDRGTDNLDQQAVAQMREALNTLLYHQLSPIHSSYLFKRALALRHVTAWVEPSETNCVEALDFLAREGISVPQDISVVSFDNTPAAFDRSLASYDFNMPGFIQQALSFVRGECIAPVPGRKAEMLHEVEGMLIARPSLGNALSGRQSYSSLAAAVGGEWPPLH